MVPGVQISLARMNHVLEIDLRNRCAAGGGGGDELGAVRIGREFDLSLRARILHRKRPVPLAATWRPMPAVCTRSSMA